MRNLFYLIVIFCLFLNVDILYCQISIPFQQTYTDSLKGYGGFKFGQTKWDIEKKLDKINVKYDTTLKSSGYMKNQITFMDRVIIGDNKFPSFIRLSFSEHINFKLVSVVIEINFENIIFSDAENMEKNLYKILYKKYGEHTGYENSMEDSIGRKDNIFWNPKTRYYVWDFIDAKLFLFSDFHNFFKTIEIGDTEPDDYDLIYTNNLVEPNNCEISLTFRSNSLYERHIQIQDEIDMKNF